MATASEHVRYYAQQELKRDEIMKNKLKSQEERFANYDLTGVRGRFSIFRKENYTEKDNQDGMSYRIDFYIGNITCNVFTSKEFLKETLIELNERLKNV